MVLGQNQCLFLLLQPGILSSPFLLRYMENKVVYTSYTTIGNYKVCFKTCIFNKSVLGSLNMLIASTGFSKPWMLGYHLMCPWYLQIHIAHSWLQRYLNFSTQTTDNVHKHGGLRTWLNIATQSLKQGTPMMLKLRMYYCRFLCCCALRAFSGYLEGQQGITGVSAEGTAIIHSTLPLKCPENPDLKGLLGTNSVARMKFSKQSLRLLSDSHMWCFLLNT